MKNLGILLLFICFSFSGIAQEISLQAEVEIPPQFQIKRVEIRPSLSNLAPEVPYTGRFTLNQANFDKSTIRREVDMAAVMEREGQMKARIIELAPPVRMPQVNNPTPPGNETFSITPRFYNPSFSPEFQGRGTRNSVYRNAADGTGATYLHTYSPFMRYGRGFYY